MRVSKMYDIVSGDFLDQRADMALKKGAIWHNKKETIIQLNHRPQQANLAQPSQLLDVPEDRLIQI